MYYLLLFIPFPLCRVIQCVFSKLCPEDKRLFIQYRPKTRESILELILLAEWERVQRRKERGKRRIGVYRGKEVKHPSAWIGVNWISAEFCGKQQAWMRPWRCSNCVSVCECGWHIAASCQSSCCVISTTHSKFHLSPFLLLLPLPFFISHWVFGLLSNGCRPQWN